LDGLKSYIQKFVVECLVGQQNKVEIIKTPCTLQPSSIPSQHWEEVSKDFITGLPKSEGKSVIMVVVDRITNYAHFCALSHPFKANTVSTTFMEIATWKPKDHYKQQRSHFHWNFLDKIIFLSRYSISS